MYEYFWLAYFVVNGSQQIERIVVKADHEPEATEKVRVQVKIMEELSGSECVDYYIEDIIPL